MGGGVALMVECEGVDLWLLDMPVVVPSKEPAVECLVGLVEREVESLFWQTACEVGSFVGLKRECRS